MSHLVKPSSITYSQVLRKFRFCAYMYYQVIPGNKQFVGKNVGNLQLLCKVFFYMVSMIFSMDLTKTPNHSIFFVDITIGGLT
jgi:hypothetical protein